jgi:hypothetical protein
MINKRLTCGYKISGTESFRLASSKLLGYFGTNLQNPTPSLMKCVVPSPGNVFIQPDQAGAEALIVAMECRPAKYRRLFDLGIKVHSYMALQIFTEKFRGEFPIERYKQVDPDVFAAYQEVKELLNTIKHSEDEYFLGKKTIHSFSYNEGPQTFRLSCLDESEGRIALTFKEAKEFRGAWQSTFPEITEWQAITIGRLSVDRYLRNLFGYPRYFGRLWNDELERQAYAFVPQSTVGCITHLAYTELYHRIRKERLPWLLCNNKHDSLLMEIPDTTEHREMAMEYCKTHMGRELRSYRGESYRMKVGISFGHNWAHKSQDNPEGMEEV